MYVMSYHQYDITRVVLYKEYVYESCRQEPRCPAVEAIACIKCRGDVKRRECLSIDPVEGM